MEIGLDGVEVVCIVVHVENVGHGVVDVGDHLSDLVLPLLDLLDCVDR